MLKKFLIGTVVALALLVGTYASAADFGSTTLKVGSKGEAVKAVQTLVGATPIDGVFGPMTKAKVIAWQASNGLVADGLFGSMSKAKAVNGGSVVSGTTCPAGQFDPMTGKACGTVVTTLPAGCVAGYMFSPTTGAACVVGTTPVVPGVLTGGAGSIDSITKFTSGIESTVKEARDNNVLGVEIKASNGSDLAISTLSLDLTHSGAGSYRLERYVGAVSVYNGSTKVGSAMATDFSRTGEVSSKTINLSNVIVKAGEKVRLTVVFEANSSIQSSSTTASNDIGAAWNVKATALRYQDATGVVISKDSLNLSEGITFQSSTAYDTLSLQSSILNPNDANIQVKLNSVSDEVLAGAFKLKAGTDSTELSVLTIPVNMAVYNPAGGVTSINANDVINDIYLKVGSTIYDNYTATGTSTAIASGITGTATYTFDIDSGDLMIPASSGYKEVQIFVKFGTQSTKYDGNTTVLPSVAASSIVVENKIGDTVTSPSAPFTGSTMTLLVNGASVTYLSDNYTPVDNSGSPVVAGTIGITFKVVNFGDTDITIAETQTADSATSGAGLIGNELTGATASGSAIVTSSQVTKNSSSNFVVSAGDTTGKTFTLSEKFTSPGGFVRLEVKNVDGTSVTNVITLAH